MNLHSNHFLISGQVSQALAEDLGSGDLTAALLPADAVTQAQIISREQAVICGIPWVNEVYRQLDPAIGLEWLVEDGEMVTENQQLCRLSGNTRVLLSGERCALNYLQSLSGTATLARSYAEAVSGIDVRILDTRKTVPGLRQQQKYAVRCGGCHNHRVGLYDAVLIKENHIRAAGSVDAALARSKELVPDGVSVEIEVETLDELQQALKAGAQRVLLDNFTPEQLREAVKLAGGRARLEASGGINLATIREIAETGIDDISVGALTKDIRAIDLSMLFEQ
ncbi:MAG: carboxylating nicotinate-nucleotide diphosphorylase [Candidatus Thiodiazotropha weberae]|uniref:Probable nicotinate-nucleotide pyrophosphorylase [carboxylating] n=1 Tax=Candidatus Thiodiazotropha endoloripes TaxID=1818881 RepID=A0A1E2ULB4_9GAMM|nr:carboxylating nicotinate-nucleotide diphosphorylase [Candidatus Thiodiazotropha endoloripes]MCG7898913.1 carboxylating nicotinate-nucleotide diphosphorylase [Candidatus Thiodiazotropha weberae]MCG7902040.1 carboxylating nicotinate-nucleotide diphosphorylase [Candidatus Thiodiazotropha weberae]ODB83842.1 nicotinate-nucleotide diphosphorylase (carboxylating) [Candidatus Thiodiazotropha endoloripes]ODB90564.1 nicotinate-nucleotide diphosphorylase (carboxylating) [Candidatus Thiodiazotropha endo